jgi:hypoxanthine phosphoribosyltransferase
MTKDKDFKKLVRSRMTATGENFTAARAALLESSPVETAPEPHTAGIDPHIERFRTRTLATFMPAGRIISIPTKRRALVVLLIEVLAAFEADRIYSEKQVNSILAELPPGLRAPATRTDRLPAARPRLPHGPVLGESEPTDSHRFPGTGDGRARGVSALTPRRRILGARANTGQTEGAFMAYHADSSDLDEKEILTWDLFGQSARELAQTIADSDYDPEIVIAVARGGLLPAGALAYALGLKLSDAINVEFYTDVHETLPDPILLAPMLDIDAIKGKKLLVVDDVADSGRTLALVLELLRKHGAEAQSAVIYSKSASIIDPDFVWKRTDQWIVFPWSAEPPVEPSK